MASVDRTALSRHSAAGSNMTGVSTTLKTSMRGLLLVKVTWSVLLTFTACCVFLLMSTQLDTRVRRPLHPSFLQSRISSHVASNNKSGPAAPQGQKQADVFVTGFLDTLARAHKFSSVVEYLSAVNTYLLAFRSPFIRENPALYSWPETEGGQKQRNPAPRKKLVVWYNAPFHIRDHFAQYQFHHCPVRDCRVSFNYRKDHTQADAVAFLPLSEAVIPRDHADQVYVFYTMESPYYTSSNYGSTAWNTAFNWTWNFRQDSDIFQAVRYLKRSSPPPHSALLTMKRQKKKSVAWMVSHCGAQSQRDQYVRKLRKILPVDIYGSCGTLSCTRWAPECDLLLNDYLFYLSFENSMCEDYITEKFYKTFKEGVYVLPVVRGGANYSRYFPEGTFIDAEAFSSPEELGHYLLELARDEARYVDMLWKKAHFVFHEYGYIDAHCQLCYKLHHVNYFPKTYSDMFGWYHKNGCRNPKPF